MSATLNGSKWFLSALFSICMALAGAVGYLVAARFIQVESRQTVTENEIGILKIRVEILEGGEVRLDVPLDKSRLERLVMEEIQRQMESPSPHERR